MTLKSKNSDAILLAEFLEILYSAFNVIDHAALYDWVWKKPESEKEILLEKRAPSRTSDLAAWAIACWLFYAFEIFRQNRRAGFFWASFLFLAL